MLRRFFRVYNLPTEQPSPSSSSSSCEQRTPVAALLFNLRDEALSRKRWDTELIAGDRVASDCRWAGGCGELSIHTEDVFSAPWECQGSLAHIVVVVQRYTQMNTKRTLPAGLKTGKSRVCKCKKIKNKNHPSLLGVFRERPTELGVSAPPPGMV